MIVTQWFGKYKKPKYKGWYECAFTTSTVIMLYWNGKYWLPTKDSKWVSAFGHYAGDKWRGLAVKP